MNEFHNFIVRGGRALKYEKKKNPQGWHISREGMRAGCSWKEFTDDFAPFRRFLKSKIGQLWDDVYSEICSTVDQRTLRGWHFHTHLFDFVYSYSELIHWVSVYSWRHMNGQLYIDEEGYLRQAPFETPQWKLDREKKRKAPCKELKYRQKEHGSKEESWDFNVDFRTNDYLKKVDGIWYFMRARIGYRSHWYPDGRQSYPYTFYKKIQLNKKELKKWNLYNDNSYRKPDEPERTRNCKSNP